jgi:hypothetical protein
LHVVIVRILFALPKPVHSSLYIVLLKLKN